MTNTVVPENIHLIQINWVKENTIFSTEKLEVSPNYDFQITHTMMHNLDNEIVKIGIFVNMIGEVKNKPINQGGNYEVDFIFKIDQLQSYYQLVENKPLFEGVFVGTLLGISYSTIRGMLFNSWRNTVLEKVILPVVPVQELLKSKHKTIS